MVRAIKIVSLVAVGFYLSTADSFSQQLQDKKNIVEFQRLLADSLKNFKTQLIKDTKLMCKPTFDSTSHNRTSIYLDDPVFVVRYENGFYQVVRLEFGSIGFVPESALPITEKLLAIKATFSSLKKPIKVIRTKH